MNIRLIQTRANICNVVERINTTCDFSIITTDFESDGTIYNYNDRTGSKKILGSKFSFALLVLVDFKGGCVCAPSLPLLEQNSRLHSSAID